MTFTETIPEEEGQYWTISRYDKSAPRVSTLFIDELTGDIMMASLYSKVDFFWGDRIEVPEDVVIKKGG